MTIDLNYLQLSQHSEGKLSAEGGTEVDPSVLVRGFLRPPPPVQFTYWVDQALEGRKLPQRKNAPASKEKKTFTVIRS